MTRPKLTPHERKLVKALTAMDVLIDALARAMDATATTVGIQYAMRLRLHWGVVMDTAINADSVFTILKRPRTPGRLNPAFGGTGGGTKGRRSRKT